MILRRFFRGNKLAGSTDAREISEIAEGHAQAIELLASGKLAGVVSGTAAPTGGTWTQGDFLRNSAPAEAGGAGNKYVVMGWVCTVGGTPGTWLQCRTLTGN